MKKIKEKYWSNSLRNKRLVPNKCLHKIFVVRTFVLLCVLEIVLQTLSSPVVSSCEVKARYFSHYLKKS